MLPLRIDVEGFLTYRQRTILDFRDYWLWAITGANGAGKSALFDAITFVLFGEHRGGRQREDLLMSQGCDYTRVAFDLDADGGTYRVERTLTRKRGRRGQPTGLDKTYQVYVLDPGDPGLSAGHALPGTDSVAGVESWARDNIGLTYKTFTSSVLLRQGEADRFITALPAERKTVLMDVLDLKPYLRLEAASRKHWNDSKQVAEDRGLEYGKLAHATPEALELATAEHERAVMAAIEASALVRRQETTRDRAQAYAEGHEKEKAALRRLTELDAVLADAPAIEAAQQESAELDDALPKLRAMLQHCQAAVAANERAVGRRELAGTIDVASHETKLRELTEETERAEHDYDELRQALARKRVDEEHLRPVAEAAATIDRLNSDAVSADVSAALLDAEAAGLDRAEAHFQECQLASSAISILRVLTSARKEAREHDGQSLAFAAEAPALETAAAAAAEAARIAEEAAQQAAEKERRIEVELAGTKQDLQNATSELAARRAAGSEGTCSRCGQKVDAAHIAREIADGEARERALGGDFRRSETALGQQRRVAKELETGAQRAAAGRDAAAEALTEARRQARLHAEQRDRAVARANQQRASLPELYRGRSEDATYPSDQDLSAVQSLAASLNIAQRQWKALAQKAERAAAMREKAEELRFRAEETRRRFSGVDLATVAADHAAALAIIKELATDEEQARSLWQSRREELRLAQTGLSKAQEQRAGLLAEASEEEAAASAEQRAADALHGQLTSNWQARVANLDTSAIAVLEARKRELSPVASQGRALTAAREERPHVEGRLSVLREGLGKIPEEDRLPVADVEVSLANARSAQEKANDDRDKALTSKTRLAGECERRALVEQEYRRASRLAHDYGALTKYLGKDHLQAWLVQAAQETIGEAANVFLGAISGGLLRLTLQPKGDDLEILISDLSSGQDPMEVKFVSGSQRFRAAVALALAIGQYSGGASRRIKSVIIDEGFGSLDVDGRKQMIEQLKALEGTLDRVILVSHHEAFNEAFPVGYHIEKSNGSSRAVLRHETVAQADAA